MRLAITLQFAQRTMGDVLVTGYVHDHRRPSVSVNPLTVSQAYPSVRLRLPRHSIDVIPLRHFKDISERAVLVID
jgi:hypothetical protein